VRTKISADVETVLQRCFVEVRKSGHRFATVEHMILEMLKEALVLDHLKASSINANTLRAGVQRFLSKMDAQSGVETDGEPTSEFQRVLQKAILDAQSSGNREVSLIDLLTSIAGARQSLFGKRGLTARSRGTRARAARAPHRGR
jgi:ATP-dependent Clp protease ATP-binding subunit ClpA